MENAEEVMQLLEEFSKIKPREIPRELEDYLGYVAKTGDPVYQWSLVKHLFREKLLSVITNFYDSTLTEELPPCPNVEPFNYERMKTSLLERFDTFTSAPFTVQRICELLTNPRKEYNRADKYMRAIEKNILVVSTREPGSGKRPLECDSQSETVLNGIPDVKLNESDGSLLHVPTDLPYLGAPPASNDVTVETSEPNSTLNEGMGVDISEDSKSSKTEGDKPWPTQDTLPVTQETEQSRTRSETSSKDSINVEEKSPEENDCDTNNRLSNENNPRVSQGNFDREGSSDMFTQNSEAILPDTASIDSSDSSQECTEISSNLKLESEEAGSVSDENEVSSTPGDQTEDIPIIQEEVEEQADSEAEATGSSLIQEDGSGVNSLPDEEINSSERIIQTDANKTVIISELAASKSDEVDLECNEITGTVDSPTSPESNIIVQADDLVSQNINLAELEESAQHGPHPDSSNDVCLQHKATTSVDSQKAESCREADSVSESSVSLSELHQQQDVDNTPDETNSEILITGNVSEAPSPGVGEIIDEDSFEKSVEDPVLSSNSLEETTISEAQCSSLLPDNTLKLTEIQNASEVGEICDPEGRAGSVIQSIPNIAPDSQHQIATIEEISVDPSCEAEEEAMDVDDSSNQMMITEGENEGEPMDQSDQLQS